MFSFLILQNIYPRITDTVILEKKGDTLSIFDTIFDLSDCQSSDDILQELPVKDNFHKSIWTQIGYKISELTGLPTIGFPKVTSIYYSPERSGDSEVRLSSSRAMKRLTFRNIILALTFSFIVGIIVSFNISNTFSIQLIFFIVFELTNILLFRENIGRDYFRSIISRDGVSFIHSVFYQKHIAASEIERYELKMFTNNEDKRDELFFDYITFGCRKVNGDIEYLVLFDKLEDPKGKSRLIFDKIISDLDAVLTRQV